MSGTEEKIDADARSTINILIPLPPGTVTVIDEVLQSKIAEHSTAQLEEAARISHEATTIARSKGLSAARKFLRESMTRRKRVPSRTSTAVELLMLGIEAYRKQAKT